MFSVSHIQELLNEYNIDAWCMYDFRGSNSIAWKVCELPPHTHCTRRWAVIIPRAGEALKIVSAIEAHTLEQLPLREIRYSNAAQWEQALSEALAPFANVAMEYSANNAIPVVSKVDAGTVEWIRSLGHQVSSSADIAQYLQAVWTQEQIDDNVITAALVRETMMDAMQFVREKILRHQTVSEFDVQQHIVRQFEAHRLVSDAEAIVAIAANASSPHYSPEPQRNSVIPPNELLLIDMWAKSSQPWSTYADITWMCHTGTEPTAEQKLIFRTVRDARDAALSTVRERFDSGSVLHGYEVDDAARGVIRDAGFGDYFIHRTGHNIGEETHGAGANMDNYETHDFRRIINGSSFSIEPGIYIPGRIGVRSEISVVIGLDGSVHVPSDPIQRELIMLGS